VKQILATLNAGFRVWGSGREIGRKFQQFERYVYSGLTQWMIRRGGQAGDSGRHGLKGRNGLA
jgi:hypothetical protein